MNTTPDGLKAVFLAHRSSLLRMLTARLQSAEDAEDVLQDLWVKLEQMADRPIGAPLPFLFRAAANLATDRRIAGSRRGARDLAWAEHQPSADEVPGAERALIAQQDWEAVERAIERMPPRMAAALRLYRLEGTGQRAIAERLGISVSAVEKLLRKAYKSILEQSGRGAADLGEPRRHEHGGQGHHHD